MSNIRLIYKSSADLDLRLTDVKQILETARSNNAAINVCGMLYYNTKYFIQALEGDEQTISSLYEKIAEDFRHDDLEIISKTEIDDYLFLSWEMGYAGNSESVNNTLQKLNIDLNALDSLSADDYLTLLTSLAQQQEEI